MIEYQTQILIIGGGPAGLATACTLNRAGYATLIVERGAFAQGVAGWPVYMKLFSTTDLVELCGVPLAIPEEKPNRQQYLRYLHRFAQETRVAIKTEHEVVELEGEEGAFVASGRTALGEPFIARAERIVLATGAYDHPNLLAVPGEDLPKVSHYYSEVNDYIGKRVLIVGGRHSASETALELCRAGVDVTICHRGPAFTALKYWIGPDLENRIKEGRIRAFLNSHVVEIKSRSVVIAQVAHELEEERGRINSATNLENESDARCIGRAPEGEGLWEIDNDAVIALTGYHPDPEFLGRMGVEVDPARKQPVFDPHTFESTRRGVYMVGVMLAGNISGAIFIENSRLHGERVLQALQAGELTRAVR